VVELDTTTGQPPVILEAVVYRLTGGMITAGPFSYWTAPDAGLGPAPGTGRTRGWLPLGLG
jgi:hypothetical protein